MELSKTIRRLRTEKGWSQEVLAERAYVSRQTVSNWETEKSFPDVHSLLILSDLFGVSLDELIKGDVEIMKDTVKHEDAARFKKIQLRGVTGFLAMIISCTLLVELGGQIGMMLGCLLAGVLSVCIFMSFREMEQFKQEHDIQTYREVLAYLNGETLDDIEKAAELKKRSAQHRMILMTAIISGGSLLIAVIVLLAELLR